MIENETRPGGALPPPVVALLGALAVLLGAAALIALVSAVGFPALLMAAGVAGSFAFVALTVSRRRPVSFD